MTQITHNLAAVRQRIVTATERYGRHPDSVKLLAVSKRHSVAAIEEAAGAGQKDFGENFATEAVHKQPLIKADVRWHFIGKIQSNKAKLIATHFSWVHSLDRLKTARRLHQFRGPGEPLNSMIQINLSDDPERAGVLPERLLELATAVSGLSGLRLRGLMCIAPPTDDQTVQMRAFAQTRELLEDLNGRGFALDNLSMGMSGDLEAAIAQGATWVRIGTDIFGKRAPDTASDVLSGAIGHSQGAQNE